MRSAQAETEVSPALGVGNTQKKIQGLEVAPHFIIHKIENRDGVVSHCVITRSVFCKNISNRDSLFIGPQRFLPVSTVGAVYDRAQCLDSKPCMVP